jgi:hypothetical protein
MPTAPGFRAPSTGAARAADPGTARGSRWRDLSPRSEPYTFMGFPACLTGSFCQMDTSVAAGIQPGARETTVTNADRGHLCRLPSLWSLTLPPRVVALTVMAAITRSAGCRVVMPCDRLLNRKFTPRPGARAGHFGSWPLGELSPVVAQVTADSELRAVRGFWATLDSCCALNGRSHRSTCSNARQRRRRRSTLGISPEAPRLCAGRS